MIKIFKSLTKVQILKREGSQIVLVFQEIAYINRI